MTGTFLSPDWPPVFPADGSVRLPGGRYISVSCSAASISVMLRIELPIAPNPRRPLRHVGKPRPPPSLRLRRQMFWRLQQLLLPAGGGEHLDGCRNLPQEPRFLWLCPPRRGGSLGSAPSPPHLCFDVPLRLDQMVGPGRRRRAEENSDVRRRRDSWDRCGRWRSTWRR